MRALYRPNDSRHWPARTLNIVLLAASLFSILGIAAGNADHVVLDAYKKAKDRVPGTPSIDQYYDLPAVDGTVSEVHEIVFLAESYLEPNTPRHVEANAKLMKAMDRNTGKWTGNHPRNRLLTAMYGFSEYYNSQKAELDRLKTLYSHVSKKQKRILDHTLNYSNKFNLIDDLLKKNQKLCDEIVQTAFTFYGISNEEYHSHVKELKANNQGVDKISVSQALKHFVRDWTGTGLVEREAPFSCVLRTLESLYPERDNLSPVKILLPGSGLGRLGHDIGRQSGFEVTVNEWSMYMNLAYRYVEAHRDRESSSFHPFVDGWSHHATTADMTRKLVFPDMQINATSVVLVEGDFTTALSDKKGYYDVVVTYFFIDTARNLMNYIDAIKASLKPGGRWINFGPLLYGSGPWVQLSLDEVLAVSRAMGFEFLDTPESCGSLTFPTDKVRTMEAIYAFDDLALSRSAYKAQFWVAQLFK